MADTFNALRANDLIWSFFVNNYLMGKEPKPFDLLFWNSDQTRMPKTLHLFYLRKFYGENALAKGELELDGDQARPRQGEDADLCAVVEGGPHRARPARSIAARKLFGGPVTFTMAGSGHIAGVINAPVANKYQHWTNDEPARHRSRTGRPARSSTRAPGGRTGSTWLKATSGKLVPARDPGQGPAEAAGRRAGRLCEGAS